MSKKMIGILAVVIILFSFSACTKQPEQKPQEQKTPAKQSQASVLPAVYDQWSKSGHAKAVGADNPAESPGMSEGGKCFTCHNGYAFEIKAESLKNIGILKGVSCDTCHTGQGRDIISKGAVKIPIGSFTAGKGSLCMACHNGRGKEPNQKSAPHGSVQGDMLLSKSGAQVEGFKYGQHGHGKTKNTCLECHKDHSFKLTQEKVASTCGVCHKGITSFNPPSKADYDGNKAKEGMQDEVKGLLKVLESAILQKLDGGKFVSEHGEIVFQDAKGKALTTPPNKKVYNATWNFMFVSSDKSKGIHNPTYAIQLLQQSYKDLTGKDVPNAEIRK